MNEKLQDRIDNYLLGQMSAEEVKKFAEDLNSDPQLLEQYNYTKMVRDTVCEQATLEELMNQWDEEIEAERGQEEWEAVACAAAPEQAIPEAYGVMTDAQIHEAESEDWEREEVSFRGKSDCDYAEESAGMPEQRMAEAQREQALRREMERQAIQAQEHAAESLERPAANIEHELVSPTHPMRRWQYWVSGIAALLAVGCFVTLPLMRDDAEYMQGPILPAGTARNGGDLAQIESLILNKDFDKALTAIEEAEKEMHATAPAFAPADTLDDELREQMAYEANERQLRTDDLKWLKVYALIGLEREKEALSLLDQLRNGNGEYKESAGKLYLKLKE